METEMENIYAAPLTVSLKVSKGSILHVTCHFVARRHTHTKKSWHPVTARAEKKNLQCFLIIFYVFPRS